MAEHRALFGDRDVADDLQHIASAHGETVDRSDHRLLQLVDGLVHLEGRQHAGVEQALLHALLAAADTEELVAGTGQHDYTGARLAPDLVDAIADLMAHEGREHVAVLRSVQRDRAHRAVFAVSDFLERHEVVLIK